MRFIRFEREDEAEEWARKKLELSRAPEFFRCLSAVDRDNNFVCVVVLTNFSSRGVDMNIALEGKKMTPKSTVEMFNYIFGFLFEELEDETTARTRLLFWADDACHLAIN